MAESSGYAPGCFVLSLPRSGSTLLRLILNSHSQIYAPDELRLGRLCHGLFCTLEGLKESGGLSALRQDDFAASPEALAETRAWAAELMTRHTRRKGKTIWCEKSPDNLLFIRTLIQIFGEAKYILLHRHCLDLVMSCISASQFGFQLAVIGKYISGSEDNFVMPLIRAWVENVNLLLDFEGAFPERCTRLRYEDLVTSPLATLGSLCSFLGVPLEKDLIAKAFSGPQRQRLHAGDPNAAFSMAISGSSVGHGKKVPWSYLEGLPGYLFEAMNRALQDLGYPPVTGASWEVGSGTAAGERPPSAVALDLKDLFERLVPERLARGAGAKLKGSSYQFTVLGGNGGSWLLDLAGDPGRIVPQGGAQAQCKIEIAEDDLKAIIDGGSNPALLYRDGKVRVEGRLDLEALRALVELLSDPHESALATGPKSEG